MFEYPSFSNYWQSSSQFAMNVENSDRSAKQYKIIIIRVIVAKINIYLELLSFNHAALGKTTTQ